LDHLLLVIDQLTNAATRELDEASQLRIVKGPVLGCGLHLDEPARASHDNVGIDICARVFLVVKVEYGLAADNPDTGRRNCIEQRRFL
jgi:hypothetical protein